METLIASITTEGPAAKRPPHMGLTSGGDEGESLLTGGTTQVDV
jgi:hypothetical protein